MSSPNKTFVFSCGELNLFNKYWNKESMESIIESSQGNDSEGQVVEQYKFWLSLSEEQRRHIHEQVYTFHRRVTVNLIFSS